MKLITADYILEPHSSGKNTCFIATDKKTSEKYFIKYPRTIDNVQTGMEEIFNELLGENVISTLGVLDREYQLQLIDFKPAIIQPYYPQNWSNSEEEGVEIVNRGEWASLLVAETWMGQTDRGPAKPEHVALSLVEGVGFKYRAIPVDLGHAFIGAPSGMQRLDEDMSVTYPGSLFWSTGDFTRGELEAAITHIESLPVYELIYSVVEKIRNFGCWSNQQLEHLKHHADKVADFLLTRRKKLRSVLLTWFDQAHLTTQSEVMQAQVAV